MPTAIATGGTTTWINNGNGSYEEIHTFTSNGTFTLSKNVSNARILWVAGGGVELSWRRRDWGSWRIFTP